MLLQRLVVSDGGRRSYGCIVNATEYSKNLGTNKCECNTTFVPFVPRRKTENRVTRRETDKFAMQRAGATGKESTYQAPAKAVTSEHAGRSSFSSSQHRLLFFLFSPTCPPISAITPLATNPEQESGPMAASETGLKPPSTGSRQAVIHQGPTCCA
jgi:hypothetical protein